MADQPPFTSHLALVLPLTTIIWGFVHVDKLLNSGLHWVKQFVLPGTPRWLILFLIFVEIVRVRVRPLTLGFRIAANLTRGHIVLTLLNCVGYSLPCAILYYIFEYGIACLQAYILVTLVTLYHSEL